MKGRTDVPTSKNKPGPKGSGAEAKATPGEVAPVTLADIEREEAAQRQRMLAVLEEIVQVAHRDPEVRAKLFDTAGAVARRSKAYRAELTAAAKHTAPGKPAHQWPFGKCLTFLLHYRALQSSGYYPSRDELLEELGRAFDINNRSTLETRIRRCLSEIKKDGRFVAEVEASAQAKRLPRGMTRGT